ncbi:hypothetical protein CC79DRAFT_1332656 [Sarocladium strictum]
MPVQAGPTRGMPTLRYEGPRVVTNNTPFQFKIVSDKLFHGQPGCTEKIKLTLRYLPVKYGVLTSGNLEGTFDPSGGDKSIWTWSLTCDTSMAPTKPQTEEALAAGRTSMHLPDKLEFEYLATETIPKSLVLGRPPTSEEQARSEDVVAEYPKTFTVDVQLACDFSLTGMMGL